MEGRSENMGAIYRIYNTETRQSYIGQSNRPYHRIQDHLTPGCPNASREIQVALSKHLPQSWQWEIVADMTDRKANEESFHPKAHTSHCTQLERRIATITVRYAPP